MSDATTSTATNTNIELLVLPRLDDDERAEIDSLAEADAALARTLWTRNTSLTGIAPQNGFISNAAVAMLFIQSTSAGTWVSNIMHTQARVSAFANCAGVPFAMYSLEAVEGGAVINQLSSFDDKKTCPRCNPSQEFDSEDTVAAAEAVMFVADILAKRPERYKQLYLIGGVSANQRNVSPDGVINKMKVAFDYALKQHVLVHPYVMLLTRTSYNKQAQDIAIPGIPLQFVDCTDGRLPLADIVFADFTNSLPPVLDKSDPGSADMSTESLLNLKCDDILTGRAFSLNRGQRAIDVNEYFEFFSDNEDHLFFPNAPEVPVTLDELPLGLQQVYESFYQNRGDIDIRLVRNLTTGAYGAIVAHDFCIPESPDDIGVQNWNRNMVHLLRNVYAATQTLNFRIKNSSVSLSFYPFFGKKHAHTLFLFFPCNLLVSDAARALFITEMTLSDISNPRQYGEPDMELFSEFLARHSYFHVRNKQAPEPLKDYVEMRVLDDSINIVYTLHLSIEGMHDSKRSKKFHQALQNISKECRKDTSLPFVGKRAIARAADVAFPYMWAWAEPDSNTPPAGKH